MEPQNPAPTDWENRYRSTDTPWDKGAPHPLLATLSADPAVPGPIVAPGCGTGWDLGELARKHPKRMVVGIDIANSAVAAARARTRRHANVRIELGDFLAPPPAAARGGTAMIWEHTCFCALHPAQRAAYVATATHLLPPGGLLAGVFFLTLDDGGSGPPWNTPAAELHRLFSPHFHVPAPVPCPVTFPGRESTEWFLVMTRA